MSPESMPERSLAELRQAVLDDWIVVTTRASRTIEQMESTFSWRVTKPLRIVRTLHRSVDEQGYSATRDLIAGALARRLGRE